MALCASKSLASLIEFCAIDVALTAHSEYIVVEVITAGFPVLRALILLDYDEQVEHR